MPRFSVFDSRYGFNEEVPATKLEPLSNGDLPPYHERIYIMQDNFDLTPFIDPTNHLDIDGWLEDIESAKLGKVISDRINS